MSGRLLQSSREQLIHPLQIGPLPAEPLLPEVVGNPPGPDIGQAPGQLLATTDDISDANGEPVAFVGAPAITAGGMILLFLSLPVLLSVWSNALNAFLANPYGGGP